MGTDAFIQHFVKDKCQAIMEDVDKVDNIQDGFIHYQLTRDAYRTWNQQDITWVDMRLHESHDEGRSGVPNNTITRRPAAYTTNTRFVAFLGTFACPAQQVWLPGNNLQDPATWMAPLWQLKQMHEDLLQHYDCTYQ
jgi:hypothetical protein